MTTSEFLEQFSLIEKNLLSKAPAFDPKEGFFNLLKYLQSNKILSDDLIILLRDIFQIRNKVVSSPSGIALSSDVLEKIQQIKQGLKL